MTCYAQSLTEAVTTVITETCLSPQVYDLVTKRDHVIQYIDYLDDQFTINVAVMKEQFGPGTAEVLT